MLPRFGNSGWPYHPAKGYLKIGQDIFQAARRFAYIIRKYTRQRYG